MKTWTVPPSFHQKRVIDFIYSNLTISSKRKLKEMIESGVCLVNGKVERFASKPVYLGDHVQFQDSIKSTDRQNRLTILFEDEELIVIDKPCGLVCERPLLQKFVGQKIYLCHRLDKQTSGALILPKTKPMFEYFKQSFKDRKIQKTYVAIVDGLFKENSKEIKSYLVQSHFFEGQTIWASNRFKKGRFSHTQVEKIDQGDNYSILQCTPITGRTHQIRVHLKECGHPILGDFQYSRSFAYQGFTNRLLLHSYKVGLFHPKRQKKLCIEAPIPFEMEEFLQQKHENTHC